MGRQDQIETGRDSLATLEHLERLLEELVARQRPAIPLPPSAPAEGERLFAPVDPAPPHEIDDDYLAVVAKSLYLSRRLRERYLGSGLLGEPAWDMLLDLFVRAAEGKRTAVTSLCMASGVPASTALRWIGSLQDAGLVVREDAEHDRRIAYLKLSAQGFAAMRRYLIDAVRYVRPARLSYL
jgi:DNA-binding MarR family transcriptional regulator